MPKKSPFAICAVVLSSDDEANDGSAAGAGRLDGGSPQPADSAHSSPAPCGGRVEAAVKSGGEPEDPSADFFEDVNMKFVIPRRSRMKDQVGFAFFFAPLKASLPRSPHWFFPIK